MIRNHYADCALLTEGAQEFLMIRFYHNCSQLKDILIKYCSQIFSMCIYCSECFQTVCAATEIPGLHEVNKTFFWDNFFFSHIVTILTAKPRWRSILLNKINFPLVCWPAGKPFFVQLWQVAVCSAGLALAFYPGDLCLTWADADTDSLWQIYMYNIGLLHLRPASCPKA